MASLTFRLRKSTHPPYRLVADISFDGQRKFFSTRVKVDPDEWNKHRQRPKSTCVNRILVEDEIERVRQAVQMAYRDNLNASFGQFYQAFTDIVHSREPGNLQSLWSEFVEAQHYAHRTEQKFASTLKLLVNFGAPPPEEMTLRFADQFKSYLYRRGQSNETASKYMQCIKRFLSWCYERGIIKQTEWKKSEFGVPRQQKVQHVALTEEQVARLSGLDLSGTDKSVRDLFLWMCYTGQRWSDVERLRPDAVQNGVLIYHPWKTRARSQVVRVPLVGWSDPAAEIFERIKSSRRAVCSQVFNRRLKTLCRQAEINSEFVRTRRSGSKETTEVFETWQMVSAHTGRRTFATVLLTRGVPVNVVAKLTGHRSLKTLEKYEQASTDYALQQYISRFSE